MFGTAIFNT